MGQKQSKLRKFTYFEQLPMEIRVIIISYMPTIYLYYMTRTAHIYATIIRRYKLLSSRRIRKSNTYCNYYICDSHIIGPYIYFYPPLKCIILTYCRHGSSRHRMTYRIEIEENIDAYQLYSISRAGYLCPKLFDDIRPWLSCVRYDNPHGNILRKLFSQL
jgi:hypothetical protein